MNVRSWNSYKNMDEYFAGRLLTSCDFESRYWQRRGFPVRVNHFDERVGAHYIIYLSLIRIHNERVGPFGQINNGFRAHIYDRLINQELNYSFYYSVRYRISEVDY